MFKGLVKLCLDDDASKRPTSQTLLPQMKRIVAIMLAKTPFKDLTRARSLVVQIFGDFACK